MTFWVQAIQHATVASTMFQSLFYWNDLLSNGLTLAHYDHVANVSILVLLEWPSEWAVWTFDIWGWISSFNPCSIGMTFWVYVQALELNGHIGVSILVLLEWPSESNRPTPRGGLIFLFQSLFYWNDLLSTCEDVGRDSSCFLFQSLFYWNDLLSVALQSEYSSCTA